MAKWVMHWSHISALLRCGIQFMLLYIEGRRRAPAIAMIVGSGTHKAAEVCLRHKMRTGKMATIDEVVSAARDSVHAAFRAGDYWLSPDQVREMKPGHWRDQAVDDAVRLAMTHRRKLAPLLNPIHVERRWYVRAPHHPFDLAGTIDVDEVDALHDLKTASRQPPATAADTSGQLTLYGLARKVLREPASRLCLDFLINGSSPRLEIQETTRSDADYDAMLRFLEQAWLCIERGAFLPADPEGWCCNPKWCGFYDECPYARGRKQFSFAGARHGEDAEG